GENIFYYLTLYNEPYTQPPEPQQDPEETQQGLLRGLCCHKSRPHAETSAAAPRARILASGAAMQWELEAQQLLAEDWGVAAEVWSATSWTELRREAMACDRWNQLHPDQEQRVPYLTEKLNHSDGPVLAASDFMRAVSDQIAPWVPQ